MKSNVFLTSAIAVIFTAMGVYSGSRHAQAAAPQTPAVSTLFAASLPDIGNQTKALSQWKGKVLLVNFWATWCTPCVQEMPALSALQIQNKLSNIQIIGIGVDSVTNIRNFSAKYKIAYPLYAAESTGSELMRELGDQTGGLPFSVLISPNGEIKKTYLGKLNVDEVKKDLASLQK